MESLKASVAHIALEFALLGVLARVQAPPPGVKRPPLSSHDKLNALVRRLELRYVRNAILLLGADGPAWVAERLSFFRKTSRWLRSQKAMNDAPEDDGSDDGAVA